MVPKINRKIAEGKRAPTPKELKSATALREKIEKKLSEMKPTLSVSKSKQEFTERQLKKAEKYEYELNVFNNHYNMTIALNQEESAKDLKKAPLRKI